MKLANHIKELLYRYDCVIVPNFGGFVTHSIGASYQKSTNTFYPPTKKVSFNHHLHKSDGLLINHVAATENISYEKAAQLISREVLDWQKELQNDEVVIDAIGKFSLNENKQVVFEPITEVNYLIDSFGLTAITSEKIKRSQETRDLNTKSSNTTLPLLKYAAAAAVIISLGFVGNRFYQNNLQQVEYAKKEKALEKKIQSATFEISNPLPTIELNVTKKVAAPFHVVAGSFQYTENAKKKVAQLTKKGYPAQIIGYNKWGLTQVAFKSFANRNDAINFLYKIQKSESKDAWLLTK